MVEAAPPAPFVVPKPDLLLELLIIALDTPAQLGKVNELREASLQRRHKLHYTRTVFDEALRLYRPVHSLAWRQAIADDEVCGRKIPGGSLVGVIPWVIHRHQALWENPNAFDPDRFDKDRSRRLKLPAPFSRRIARSLDADAAGQATFYGCFDEIGCEEGERDGHVDLPNAAFLARAKLGDRGHST